MQAFSLDFQYLYILRDHLVYKEPQETLVDLEIMVHQETLDNKEAEVKLENVEQQEFKDQKVLLEKEVSMDS